MHMKRTRLFGIVAGTCVVLVVIAVTFVALYAGGDSGASAELKSAKSQAVVSTSTSPSSTEPLSMRIESSVDKNAVLPAAQAKTADIVVYGTVTKIDPGRWNSVDGKAWTAANDASAPVVYTTFYVEPITVLKGKPSFGTPIAFMSPGGTEGRTDGSVEIGQEVIVFGDYNQALYGDVYWNKEAYFPQTIDYSIFVKKADGTLANVADPQSADLSGFTVDEMSKIVAESLEAVH